VVTTDLPMNPEPPRRIIILSFMAPPETRSFDY